MKIIGIKQRQRFSVRIEHFKDANIRLIHGQVFALLERNSVEFVRGEKDPVIKHVLELEVGLHLRFIEIVFGLTHFFGVKLPVGRAKFESAFLSVD